MDVNLLVDFYIFTPKSTMFGRKFRNSKCKLLYGTGLNITNQWSEILGSGGFLL